MVIAARNTETVVLLAEIRALGSMAVPTVSCDGAKAFEESPAMAPRHSKTSKKEQPMAPLYEASLHADWATG